MGRDKGAGWVCVVGRGSRAGWVCVLGRDRGV